MERRAPDYALLAQQVDALAQEGSWYVPLMANCSALLYEMMDGINWAGFYIVRDGMLVLGPFQGKTACIHIPRDRGVCGAAWREDRTMRVPDVHAFPGHIACDSASRSEIVIPIHREGEVAAVLDIDSPWPARFSEEDQAGLEAVVCHIEQYVQF